MSAKHKVYKKTSIQVMRRKILPPLPGSAEPRHEYTAVFTTRADVKTRGGTTEFARVDVNGKQVTHTFTIRWTSIPFDTRDRIRTATGDLYQILSRTETDLDGKEYVIHCTNEGAETVEAAR